MTLTKFTGKVTIMTIVTTGLPTYSVCIFGVVRFSSRVSYGASSCFDLSQPSDFSIFFFSLCGSFWNLNLAAGVFFAVILLDVVEAASRFGTGDLVFGSGA